MDPLPALREFVSAGKLKEVELQSDGSYRFGDKYTFPRETPTSFKVAEAKGSNTRQGLPSLPFYTLEEIMLFLEQKKSMGNYVKVALAQRVGAVDHSDREELDKWLSGALQRCSKVCPADPWLLEHHAREVDEFLEPAAKRQKVLAEGAAEAWEGAPLEVRAEMVAQQERRLRDRNSQLRVPRALTLAKKLALEGRNADRHPSSVPFQVQGRAQPPGSSTARKPSAASLIKPSGRLEREVKVDQGLAGAARLGINMGAPQRPVGTRAAPLLPPQRPLLPPGPPQPPSSSARSFRRPRSSKPAPGASLQRSSGHKPTPIILLPPGETSLVNMWNAQTMLEQGLYKPADVCRAEAAAKKQAKPTALHIKRVNKAGRPIKFEITDRLPADKSRWQRVVALFCQGKAWQFKQYPDEGHFKGVRSGDTVGLFKNILGVYMHLSDEQVPPDIRKWNVKILPLSRNNRHNDVAQVGYFFEELDRFLAGLPAKAKSLAVS